MTDDRLIWCDIETTGLDPHREMLLEVGFKITDLELNVTAETNVLFWSDEYTEYCIKENIDPFVWEMHTKSTLWEYAQRIGTSPYIARTGIINWLEKNKVTRKEPICGSSVQFDRKWLEVWIPEAIGQFSYRNIDISTLKELCMRLNPDLYKKLAEDITPAKQHRALPDIDDTIEEFRGYRDSFLFWKD